ncbi:unnamed protein product [Caretta caretta]
MLLSPHPLSIWLLSVPGQAVCPPRGRRCAVVFSPFGDAPMTRIVFCKEGKEISVQPKEGNKLVYDSPHPVSRESSGAFSCHYQLMDNSNQENNSLRSDARYLHVAGNTLH